MESQTFGIPPKGYKRVLRPLPFFYPHYFLFSSLLFPFRTHSSLRRQRKPISLANTSPHFTLTHSLSHIINNQTCVESLVFTTSLAMPTPSANAPFSSPRSKPPFSFFFFNVFFGPPFFAFLSNLVYIFTYTLQIGSDIADLTGADALLPATTSSATSVLPSSVLVSLLYLFLSTDLSCDNID